MKGHPDYEPVVEEVTEEPAKKPIGRPKKTEAVTDTPEVE
jgi:hypothetical protein